MRRGRRVALGLAAFTALALLASLACTHGADTRHGAEPRIELAQPAVLELLPGRVPLVTAAVDGHPDLVFLLDSGAAVTLIDAASARALGLAVSEHTGPWSTGDAAGRSWPMNHYADLRHVEIGALSLHDVHVQVLDWASARSDGWFGILGQDVMGRLTLIFDMDRRQLHALPPGSTEESITAYIAANELGEGEWAIVKLHDVRERPSLTMTSKDQEYRLVIDTGATSTAFPKPALAALGLEPLRSYEARTVGGVHSGLAYRVERLDWFGFTISANVQDCELEHGRLGMNILSEFVFVLDGPGQRLWMHRRASDGAAAGVDHDADAGDREVGAPQAR